MKKISDLIRFFLNYSFIRFGLVAGIGWLLDFAVFLSLVDHIRPFWANLCAALIGITFAFAVSTRFVFQEKHHFAWHKFITYLVFCLIVAHLLSALVDFLIIDFVLSPAIVKIGVTPLSFIANYLFMRWLLHRKPKVQTL